MNEFNEVLNSPGPVVISSWNEQNNGNNNLFNAATAAGMVGQSSSVSMGGGLKQTVSLSHRNAAIQVDESESDDDDDGAGAACCDACRSFIPMFEDIAKAADSHPLAKEKAAEVLKNARDAVLQVANEALCGRKEPSDSNSQMASSNVPGMDKSSQSNRKRPALERFVGSKSSKRKH